MTYSVDVRQETGRGERKGRGEAVKEGRELEMTATSGE